MPTSIPKHRLFLMYVAQLGLLLGILNLSSLAKASGEIYINVDALNVRSGPGLEHRVMAQLDKGASFAVENEQDSWYQITVDGQKGWVASWLVEFKATSGTIKQAQSLVDRLNVRAGPGTSFKLVTQIRPEQAFPILKEEGEWLQIQLSPTEQGWVATWLVEQIDRDAAAATQLNNKAYVEATILNVRSKPNLDSAILGKLNQGQEIQILDVTQGWYKIKWQEAEGWIASEYVKQEAGQGNEPPATGEIDLDQDQSPSSEQPADQDSKSPPTGGQQQFEVTASVLNVRAANTLDAEVIGKLQQGTVVDKVSQQGDWLEIIFEDATGWVAEWLVQSIAQETDQLSNRPKVTVLNDGTNIRSGPGTHHSVVQRADQGKQFAIVSTEGDWFQIDLENGQTAYIAGWIVSSEGVPNVHKNDLLDYLNGKKIVIDAGHGGKDSGATGSHFGTLEKVINLQVAKLLQQKFSAAGAKTVMTRTTDRFLTLQQRVDVSILEKADAFLSVHHNTNNDKSIHGSITYFYKNTDQQLAKIIQQELVKANGLKDLNARKGNFFVLRENPRPGALIELAFISNYNDELTARKSSFQENSADGILIGVAKYFKEKGQ